MTGSVKHRLAFTLIELLVVVAIIVLLIAVVVPILSRARDFARRTICMANLASVGKGFYFFVSQREGRFPNKATWLNTNPGGSEYNLNPESGWAPYWESILNWEYYHGNDMSLYPSLTGTPINSGQGPSLNDEPTCGPIIRFWTFWDPVHYKPDYLKNRYATCPNYKAWVRPDGVPYEWSRPYIANQNVTGGWDGNVFEGEYGKLLNKANSVFYNYKRYALGTRPEDIANAGGKFMVFESEFGDEALQINSDTKGGHVPSAPTGGLHINDDAFTPPWTAGANIIDGSGNSYPGFFAFRHMLSPDMSLWQSQAQAAIVYVDGHTGFIGVNDQPARPCNFVPQ